MDEYFRLANRSRNTDNELFALYRRRISAEDGALAALRSDLCDLGAENDALRETVAELRADAARAEKVVARVAVERDDAVAQRIAAERVKNDFDFAGGAAKDAAIADLERKLAQKDEIIAILRDLLRRGTAGDSDDTEKAKKTKRAEKDAKNAEKAENEEKALKITKRAEEAAAAEKAKAIANEKRALRLARKAEKARRSPKKQKSSPTLFEKVAVADFAAPEAKKPRAEFAQKRSDEIKAKEAAKIDTESFFANLTFSNSSPFKK